mmetsp:Transcript_778/g.960  ORF Transcript_778/g.960 Transcript_778/m.960 type:complete len:185 (+) Transcript_778:64-618(+)
MIRKHEWDSNPLSSVHLSAIEIRFCRNKNFLLDHKKLKNERISSANYQIQLFHREKSVLIIQPPCEYALCHWMDELQSHLVQLSLPLRRCIAGYLKFSGSVFYVVFQQTQVSLYEKTSQRSPRYTFQMNMDTVVKVVSDSPCSFSISTAGYGTNTLTATSEDECIWWVDMVENTKLSQINWLGL